MVSEIQRQWFLVPGEDDAFFSSHGQNLQHTREAPKGGEALSQNGISPTSRHQWRSTTTNLNFVTSCSPYHQTSTSHMHTTKMERTHTLTFLDLPPKVRNTIYALSGLTRLCPIDLTDGLGVDEDGMLHRARSDCWEKQRLRGLPGASTLTKNSAYVPVCHSS